MQAGIETSISQAACPVCGGGRLAPIIRIAGVPLLCNRFWSTSAEAMRAPTGDLDIAECQTCSHIFNAAFDPNRIQYDNAYENSLHFSSTFSAFTTEIAQRLVDRYNMKAKVIAEIGCGDAEFLRDICERGGNSGVGFDPSQTSQSWSGKKGAKLQIIGDTYCDAAIDSSILTERAPDLICCRHVLEHLDQPRNLLQEIRNRNHGNSETVVYFEVPNGEFVMRPEGVWDLIYEHVSYFSEASLRYLFQSSGYRILRMGTGFADQALWIEATPSDDRSATEPECVVPRDAMDIRKGYKRAIEGWQRRLARLKEEGDRVAVWGAGSKGVTFLNIADKERSIHTVVDINPRKRGRFIPVTRQKVVFPDELSKYAPGLIVIMNAAYRREIKQKLNSLGMSTEIVPAAQYSSASSPRRQHAVT